jgi:hypothetical protein
VRAQSASKLHAALAPSNWQYLAGQYYYNAESQKIRIDSTIPGGFISSYSYFAYVDHRSYLSLFLRCLLICC